MPNCFCIEFEQGKDLADIVGVFQKEGDYNEVVEEEDTSVKKYARTKPKEELLLQKEIPVNNVASGSNSNVNSNNTLYSSKKEGLEEATSEEKVVKEENEEQQEQDASAGAKEEAEAEKIDEAAINLDKKDETINSLDNVAINIDTIEDIIKNISIDINKEPNETNLSNNTLHSQNQEKIPYFEWINRVVTKSTAYFYTDSPPKLTQWIKQIEESPCFQITK